MPTATEVGKSRTSGDAVFVVTCDSLEELPDQLSLPCPRFVLFLAYDHGKVAARLTATLERLLSSGCVYLCAWGIGCEHVHDTMDDVVLERELINRSEQCVMTTWHANDSLEEAAGFALQWATPDDALRDGCAAIVLASVGNSEWPDRLRILAQAFIE